MPRLCSLLEQDWNFSNNFNPVICIVHNLLVFSFSVQSLPFLPTCNCLSPPWTIPCFCTNPSVPTCLFPPVWWCLPPVVGQQHGPAPLTYPTHLQDTSGKYLNCATSIDHVGCLVGKLCRHAYMVSLCISVHFMSCQFSCLYIPPFSCTTKSST